MKAKRMLGSLLAIALLSSSPASAGWQIDTIDGSGADLAAADRKIWSNLKAAYFFIAAGNTDDSDPLFIEDGFVVDVCVDDDVGAPGHGSNSTAIDILHAVHALAGTVPTLDYMLRLLGASLTGVADPSDPTISDCIYDLAGPRWILVDPQTGPVSNGALVSVISREKR